MPKGTRHVLTGTLDLTGFGYALQMDDGGRWRIDTIRSIRRYLGQRVIVEGFRSGFDLLDVHRITPASSAPTPSRSAISVLSILQRLPKRLLRVPLNEEPE